jgi:hypothetical protein
MGGACSIQQDNPYKPQGSSEPHHSVCSDDDIEEIDADILFPTLLKLSFIFDLDYSIARKLIAAIVSSDHISFDDKCSAVGRWEHQYADLNSKLSYSEISQLIKYVELYNNDNESWGVNVKSHSEMVKTIEERCRLMCPFVSEIAAWTAEIRGCEMHKSVRKILQETEVCGDYTARMSNTSSREWSDDSYNNVDANCVDFNQSNKF